MAKTLIIGGSNLLGRYLARRLSCASTWHSCHQPWCQYQMDVRDIRDVRAVFGRVKPEAVIMLAAVGDVDWVQNNYLEAKEVNLDGLRNVLSVAAEYGSYFLYISSNAVFGGDNPPYSPRSERNPVNAYGSQRKTAEDMVSRYQRSWCVVRLFLLYGWHPRGARGNWATTVIDCLNRRRPVRLVSDRYWQPSYAGHVASALDSLLVKRATGFWHVMGRDRVSLYEFGRAVAEEFGFDPSEVQPIASDDLPPGIAPRPVDSTYDPGAGSTIVLGGIREGLAEMREEPCGHGCAVMSSHGWVPEAGCPFHDCEV